MAEEVFKMTKQDYKTPSLVLKGSAEKITHGGSCPDTTLDATFPTSTPRGDLTCGVFS